MMRRNKPFAILLALLLPFACPAQDQLPARQKSQRPVPVPKQAGIGKAAAQPVEITNSLPSYFKETKENRIDSMQCLSDLFFRLAASTVNSEDTLRILHIGDSHVRGHLFPRTTGEKLRATFGTILYQDMGINGATCLTFTHPERISEIASFRPDLLILSFGTNESHGRGYNPQVHYRQIGELAGLLHDSLPGVPLLLTTPPGSYESFRRKRRKRTYAVNPRTETAAGVIRRYAREHGLAVWDLYEITGGKANACANWQRAGVMRPDHVHYTPDGYRLQGELFYEAFIKAYNESVAY